MKLLQLADTYSRNPNGRTSNVRVMLVHQNEFGIRRAKISLWSRALFEELILSQPIKNF